MKRLKFVLFSLLATAAFGQAAIINNVANAAPTCAVGTKGAAPVATLNFSAITVNTDGTAATGVTYNLYQGNASGTEVKVASSMVAGAPNAISVGLTANSTAYFYITAVEGGIEGAPSNEGCKTFPASVPGTVVITIT